MAKAAVKYACTDCGYSAGRWFGKCPGCSAFGTLVEELAGPVGKAKAGPALLGWSTVDAEEARDLDRRAQRSARWAAGCSGVALLVGGEPGVGKWPLRQRSPRSRSTGARFSSPARESVAQVKLRAERLGGAGRVEILAETELDVVCEISRPSAPTSA